MSATASDKDDEFKKFIDRAFHKHLNTLVDHIYAGRSADVVRSVRRLVEDIRRQPKPQSDEKESGKKKRRPSFPLVYSNSGRNWVLNHRIASGRIYMTPLKKDQQDKLLDVVTELYRFKYDAGGDRELQAEYAPVLRRACLAYLKAVGKRAVGHEKPLWDRETFKLTYADQTVLTISREAPEVITVLDCLQEEDWRERIGNPFSPRDKVHPTNRLRNTASDLNKMQKKQLGKKVIHFGTREKGKTFYWRALGSS